MEEVNEYLAIVQEAERSLGPNQEPSPGKSNDAAVVRGVVSLPVVNMTFARVAELCLSEKDRAMDADTVAEKLTGIKVVRLGWQGFKNIDSLDAFTAIEDLYLQYNRIKKIENLDFMHRLKFLALGNNSIEKVENLKHLHHLELLDLNCNLIETVDVEELPQSLRNVDFTGNKCQDQEGYHQTLKDGLPNLVVLDDCHILEEKNPEVPSEETVNADELLKESKNLRPRNRPGSALGRSDAMMEAAMSRIDEMCKSTSLRTKSSFSTHRKAIAQRSKERMKQRDSEFQSRVIPTVENTLPKREGEERGEEAPTREGEEKGEEGKACCV